MGAVIHITHLTLGTPTCIVCGSPFERRAVYWECVGCGNRIRHNRTTPDDVAWSWAQVAQAAITHELQEERDRRCAVYDMAECYDLPGSF